MTAIPEETTTCARKSIPPDVWTAAAGYVAKGFSVIPLCRPDLERGGCLQHGPTCPHPGKRPLLPWAEYQSRLPTERELVEWADRWWSTNLGIVCGSVSRLLVLDCDGPEAEALVESHLAGSERPPSVRTGGGGRHFYFEHPSVPTTNRVRVGGVPLDVRSDRGQAAGPPSLHASGGTYRWITPLALLPTLPETLLQFIRTTGPRARREDSSGPLVELPNLLDGTDCVTTLLGRRALLRATLAVVHAPRGTRNQTLFVRAAHVFELVAGGEVNGVEAYAGLAAAASAVGLDDVEIGPTLASARRHGFARPHSFSRLLKLGGTHVGR